MSSNEVGMNVEDAYEKGAGAEEYAAGFKGLEADFEDILVSASSSSGNDPGVVGWKKFLESQGEYMDDVSKHGQSIGNNTQSAASQGGQNDEESGSDFAGASASGDLPLDVNNSNGRDHGRR
ncbi:hypothetical protein F4561_005057 [Lipingzhangella halophila]|uniref:Type VII secretion system (Wss) protein ESAT-6 n=1 Tax=Lipingzhangella halophila TaxID=1783352 RepID=A0A7W7RM01_9ACTN|nr:hypothetical protein [Lipingzhangella halophila]MBB4934237.1 hypothetical protein [Lipingzhangella halophila]